MAALLVFASSAAFAQDFSGMWIGYLYTDPEGKGTKMQFAIELGKHSEGKYDGGCKLQVELNRKTYGITTNITATVSGGELSFKDDGVIKKWGPDDNIKWCTKFGRLHITTKGSDKILGGTVDGSGQSNCVLTYAFLVKK